MNIKDKVILVTGASSGIGAAMAERLASEGAVLLLVARRWDRLLQIEESIKAAGGNACAYPADLEKGEERSKLLDAVYARFGRIDILINNAGFGWYGFGYTMEIGDSLRMIDLNVKALVHLTLAVLKRMKEAGAGHIINIGSIAGSLPFQGIAMYGATKAFVESFSMALYREMRDTNIRVSVVKPGAVKTDFFTAAASKSHAQPMPVEHSGMTPGKVAGRVVSLIKRPRKSMVIPRVFSLLPLIDMLFGWLIDLIGPGLLKMNKMHNL
ncbi:MAG: SDR family NAD(P)-dependent oxidoreductase [Spirochaetales bacterium]|nr:SDR family NAD(P)-dependent oxidoreductase [Spirochaetales bacterium]